MDTALRQASHILRIETRGAGLVEFTDAAAGWVRGTGMREGLLTLFCRHTSASLLIQENAAPAVQRDLRAFFADLAPEDRDWEHDDEGPDDMPAHAKSALTGVSLQVPVADGRMRLGTWQGLYLFEHRRRPHSREVALHLIGE